MRTVHLELPIRMTVIEAEGITVTDDVTALRMVEATAARYHADAVLRDDFTPSAVPGVAVARELFRSLGIDPTRRRPSSEAMLNRALKQKPLPNVNTLVDLGNWFSLEYLLPLGLYDRDAIQGPITLCKGGPDAGYEAISNRHINLADRYLLADDEGPFGSPMTDSRRTATSLVTRNTIVLIYAPTSYSADDLMEQTRTLADRIASVCGGEVIRCESA